MKYKSKVGMNCLIFVNLILQLKSLLKMKTKSESIQTFEQRIFNPNEEYTTFTCMLGSVVLWISHTATNLVKHSVK
jgi:hypothetical protein